VRQPDKHGLNEKSVGLWLIKSEKAAERGLIVTRCRPRVGRWFKKAAKYGPLRHVCSQIILSPAGLIKEVPEGIHLRIFSHFGLVSLTPPANLNKIAVSIWMAYDIHISRPFSIVNPS